MDWIFQGNPKRFAIDDYLALYPELIYWRTPKYADKISIGDRAFIWRSGDLAGAIAIGTVVELPVAVEDLKHPGALGDELWFSGAAEYSEPQTGIRLDEVRLSPAEGMVSRAEVKASEILINSRIIKTRVGTVFPLSESENREMERLWGVNPAMRAQPSATEGEKVLRAHYRRERCGWLKQEKIKSVIAESGQLTCELCRTTGSPPYPTALGDRIFEVHHRKPLALATVPVKTQLEDLALLCANCHRAVHANDAVDGNFEQLKASSF